MKQYHDPIPPPKHVWSARRKRRRDLVRASWLALMLRVLVVAIELAAVAKYHSSSLFVDAMGSLLDIATTCVLIVSIRFASRPPDENHPFGHGRLEPLAGFQLGILLALVGIGLFFQSSGQLLLSEEHHSIQPQMWMVSAVAVVLLEIGYQIAKRAAESANSSALAADAWHYRIDALNSLIATIALGAGALYPPASLFLDRGGAVCISLLMITIGIAAARTNLNELMDHVPPSKFFQLVRAAALRVHGVLGTEKIRIQNYGPDAHVDIDIEVQPTMSVEAAHRITQKVRAEIQHDWPAVRDVTVHVEPHVADSP